MIFEAISRSKLFSHSFSAWSRFLSPPRQKRVDWSSLPKIKVQRKLLGFCFQILISASVLFLTFSDCSIAGQEPHCCPLSRIDRFWLLNMCAMHLQFHRVDHQSLSLYQTVNSWQNTKVNGWQNTKYDGQRLTKYKVRRSTVDEIQRKM